MDASCKIQGSIHVLLCLIHKSMCPEFWVHINAEAVFSLIDLIDVPRSQSCKIAKYMSNLALI